MPTLSRLRTLITHDAVGGFALISAAALALVWANSPWRAGYDDLVAWQMGPEALGLNLSLGHWAADGLLAIFFFVVGVELKHELRVGSLSNPREAAVPMLAAVGGMIVPAGCYVAVVLLSGDREFLVGWAIPTATDIAFALAVLAVFGRGLPLALRTFLLTLAVVDDLLAIVIIAVFYTSGINVLTLLAALATVLVFAFLARSRFAVWYLLLPVGLVAWWFMLDSGVHATVAGVLLGLSVSSKARHGETEPRTISYEHTVSPISAGIALPFFAFLSAGVTVVGVDVAEVFGSPVALGVIAGLIVGKVVGVLGTTVLVVRFTPFWLPQGIGMRDLWGVGLLTGIGFTVALLIAELSFPGGDALVGAKGAVLLGSAVTAALAALTLRRDVRLTRSKDMNLDGIPDNVRQYIGGVPPGGNRKVNGS